MLALALLPVLPAVSAFADDAATPAIVRQPADQQTYALAPAELRMYVNASSTDGGYLTYQWHRSKKFDAPVAVDADGQPLSSAEITGTGSALIPAPAGTKATLVTTTPTETGYYYYWCTITNNRDGYTAKTANTVFVCAKIVDRTLADELKNGNFEDGTWIRNGQTGYDIYVPLELPAAAQETQKWVPYWNSTHGQGTEAFGHGKIIQQTMPFGQANPWVSGYFQGVELAASSASSIYQEVATVPGKIYEWSIDQIGTANQSNVAVIIGPAINEETDYLTDPSVTKRWQTGVSYTVTRSSVYKGTYTWDYPYGQNTACFFNDIVNQFRLPSELPIGNGTTAQDRAFGNRMGGTLQTIEYNGNTYYVYSAKGTGAWERHSGSYTVPEGQGTTVFAFVQLSANAPVTGTVLNNISFKSGTTSDAGGAISYAGAATIST
ncbi:MAG: hypothetical protein LBU48_03695, partial [Coriobacteriales bacterium]|nr:hypothetical protein [Coriobacteriales bacterium]